MTNFCEGKVSNQSTSVPHAFPVSCSASDNVPPCSVILEPVPTAYLWSSHTPSSNCCTQNPGVSAYRPEAVLSELADGSRVPALCFNLVVPPGAEETNSEYATKLRALARRLEFPSGYVETIR